MKQNKKWIKKAKELVASGQADKICLVSEKAVAKKKIGSLIKRLRHFPDFSISDKGIIMRKGKTHLSAFAVWKKGVNIDTGSTIFRFVRLKIFLFNSKDSIKQYTFLIPCNVMDGITELPGVKFAVSEITDFLKTADYLSLGRKITTRTIKLKYPAKKTVLRGIRNWNKPLKDDEIQRLHEILLPGSLLFFVTMAAIDLQLRSLKKMRKAPHIVYNIVISDSRLNDFENIFNQVLSALTFANETSCTGNGPIIFEVDSRTNTNDILKCPGRFCVIHFRERDNLRPLLTNLENINRFQKCGQQNSSPNYPTILTYGHSYLRHSFSVDYLGDIQWPLGLSNNDLVLIRTAVAKLFSGNFLEKTYTSWDTEMHDQNHFAENGIAIWRTRLLKDIADGWFDNEKQKGEYIAECERYLHSEREKSLEQGKILNASYDILAHWQNYEDHIFKEKPKTSKEMVELLETEFYAIRYSPERGEYQGKTLLFFTKNSLLRLLGNGGLTLQLFPTFLEYRLTKIALTEVKKLKCCDGNTVSTIVFDQQILSEEAT